MMAQRKVTDRAHRYRANRLAPLGSKVCALCGSRQNLTVDHKDGHPDHTTRSNLRWLCKSCNTARGIWMRDHGRGRLTHQYNPAKGEPPTYEQYAWAVSQQQHSGEHGEAGAIIHATPKELRSEYARRIAGSASQTKRRRADERWNPAAAADAAFREFHGHDSKELVTVKRKVHRHEHLAGAGELRGLSVKPVGHGPVRHIGGLKKAILAFNEGMNQLFIGGGDQFLSDAELLKFGVRKPIHELETLGKVVALDYFTSKSHLGEEGGTAVYAHQLRTTNEDGRHVVVKIARYPDLIYRVLDQQMEFSGGSYEIRAEGIDK